MVSVVYRRRRGPRLRRQLAAAGDCDADSFRLRRHWGRSDGDGGWDETARSRATIVRADDGNRISSLSLGDKLSDSSDDKIKPTTKRFRGTLADTRMLGS
jgi:hypothetical protein